MSQSLVRALREREPRRRRFDLEGLWSAFASAHPAEAQGPDARRALRGQLDALAATGQLALPAARGRWDQSVEPALPHFVTLSAPPAAPRPRPVPTAWAPELSFACDITAPAQLEALRAVQGFLRDGGRTRRLVPERERSLELFGDEKRLEKLRRSQLFGAGKLDLSLLRCFSVSPPLVWQPIDGGSRTAIILENHHTYWSFCSHAERSRAYGAVIYGAGKALCRSVESLAVVAERAAVERFEYFGDLDAAGLHIARLASERASAAGLCPLVPSAHYDDLIEYPPRSGPRETCSAEDLSWLPAPLRGAVATATDQGLRWPQEYIGSDHLESLTKTPRGV